MKTRLAAALLAAVFSSLLSSTVWAQQKVKLATSMGDIVIELDAAKAPKSAENFVQYVKAGHYDGTIFHRVIAEFMIQGGGMKPDMKEKPTRAPIPLESRSGLSNMRGTVAMARTMDPNSATAQFFINVKDNPFLDQPNSRDGNGYAVFAQGGVGHGCGRQDPRRCGRRQGRAPERAGHAGDDQESFPGEMR